MRMLHEGRVRFTLWLFLCLPFPALAQSPCSAQQALQLGAKFQDSPIAILRQWIGEGAQWTQSADDSGPPAVRTGRRSITQEDRNWWAFRKPVRRDPPAVPDARWKSNPIDAF